MQFYLQTIERNITTCKNGLIIRRSISQSCSAHWEPHRLLISEYFPSPRMHAKESTSTRYRIQSITKGIVLQRQTDES